MGEAVKDALRVGFDRSIKLEFHGFYHNGIERRLTNVKGHVINDILT